jgi:FixJ family two-component response regulator
MLKLKAFVKNNHEIVGLPSRKIEKLTNQIKDFWDTKRERKLRRNKEILNKLLKGVSVKKLAYDYGLHPITIRRIRNAYNNSVSNVL